MRSNSTPIYFVHSSHLVSHHVPEYAFLNQILSNTALPRTATGCSTAYTASHFPLPHQSSYNFSYFPRRISQHYLLHKGHCGGPRATKTHKPLHYSHDHGPYYCEGAVKIYDG